MKLERTKITKKKKIYLWKNIAMYRDISKKINCYNCDLFLGTREQCNTMNSVYGSCKRKGCFVGINNYGIIKLKQRRF